MELPERLSWPEGRLQFVIDGERSAFEISEEEFSRAEHSPGVVRIEVGSFVLMVERRHGLDAPDPFVDQMAAFE